MAVASPPPESPREPGSASRVDAEAAREARRLVEEFETGARLPHGLLLWVIVALSLGWSLFQLGVASVLAVDVVIQRAVHVFCGITLAFLVFPAIRGRRRPGVFQLAVLGGISLGVGYAAVRLIGEVTPLAPPNWLALGMGLVLCVAVLVSLRGEQIERLPWFDLLFALLAGAGALYLVFDYQGLQARQGLALTREIWIGLLFMLLLLEATRRSLGPALAVIAGLFFLYQLTGPRGAVPWLAEWMPDLLAHRGASLQRAISQQYVTTEGIFGVPVGVSTAFVFLFVLFGSMLDKAGAGKYFIDVANSFLGHLRGGPAKAAVVASGMTGMVSGSSLANVVTTGTFTIPLMKRTGYPAHKAGACEVAVSTNGQLMPPVMGAAAFIIAEFVGVPYIEVVRAAAIPAFVAYFALFYIMHLEALKLGLHGIPRHDLPPRLATFIGGIHFLIPVAVLVYYLIILRRTPGYAVMVAILALAVLMLVQEPIKAWLQGRPILPALWHGLVTLFHGLLAGARNMVGIAVAVATAGIIVGSVSQTGVGLRLTEIIQILSGAMASGIGLITLPVVEFFGGNVVTFDTTTQFAIVLLITAVASLILGLGLPTTANYVVMATLTAPVIYNLGNEFGFGIPLLAAHLFVFFFGILADDTPPVGLAAYAAAGIARSDPIRTGVQGFIYDMRTAILPFMFIFNVSLLQIGVSGWLEILHIFVSALVGMMAFAAGVQGFVRLKTLLLERLVLLAVAFMLIQPNWFTDLLGVSLYGLVYLSQWLRQRRRADTA
ncbi:TRAP transporter permease [Billgrantia sp. Q4P2]|uniref:TRAP transporter permease n=1 Tax=Billgrantia sp. Q4P2 TaxID=3463857 RepID=UPI0040579A9B